MKVDMDTVAAMSAAGIKFIVGVKIPGGTQTFSLSIENIASFMNDRDQFAADCMGVEKSVYLDWLSTEGTPRCGALTKKGRRCMNQVSGGIQRSIEDWKNLDGSYCEVHGGNSSRDTRK
ncbi:MAG: hypothetical protein K8R18_16755 [Parvibaculum sp.]|uniref:hypothetical protein n=1 Tax=Parvibaculum sp. TaxID=2024848 RepID=UPI0025DCD699|nr:hypothetical protein [Parvibaculum sp.]MCE9651272.1 hypothetical protein [Parvibaculum sp.]